jgi:hypothetical protein
MAAVTGSLTSAEIGTWIARLAAALGTLACAPIGSGPRESPLLEVRARLPRVSEGVLLNEPLVVYFSEPLDRSTVTHDSVRITDADGQRARGRLEVEGESLRFVPDPVYARDLSDGGFRPATTYTVELSGFPDPAGLRSADGAPLARSLTWSFRTVVVGDPQVAVLFEDATPEHGGALTLAVGTVVEGQPLYLRSAEPLDPSTLDDAEFLFLPERGGEAVRAHARLVPRTSLPPELQTAGRGTAWLQLLPLDAPLGPGIYLLDAPELELRDYGGNPVWIAGLAVERKFTVVAAVAGLPGRYSESFLDTARRSPVPPPPLGGPEPDGTAHWGKDGAVRIRFPRAAGDGSAGAVELAGATQRGAARELRKDVRATRLTLADEAECALAAEGLVVLRAQGLLRIGGRLVRGAGDAPSDTTAGGDGGAPSLLASFDGGTLSGWLARAAAEDPAWTVLIAGGDLVVDGMLEVGTPLLLVAGGVVRISGSVAASCEGCAVAILGEGGGRWPNAERADLVLDEPLSNPLAAPLRLAVMSGPIPPRGKVARWLSGGAAGHAGAGRYRVRYLRDPDLAGDLAPRDHPSLLEGASSIRFVVELALEPGVPWDPPFVDEVVLTWEEAAR